MVGSNNDVLLNAHTASAAEFIDPLLDKELAQFGILK